MVRKSPKGHENEDGTSLNDDVRDVRVLCGLVHITEVWRRGTQSIGSRHRICLYIFRSTKTEVLQYTGQDAINAQYSETENFQLSIGTQLV